MTHKQRAIDVGLAWLMLALAYRLAMQQLVHSSFVWTGAWQDVLLAGAMTALMAAIGLAVPRVAQFVSVVLLLLVSLDAVIFARLMLAMRVGLDRQMLWDALQSDDWKVLQTAGIGDWLAVLLAPAVLLSLRVLPHGRARVRPVVLIVAGLLLSLGWIWAVPRPADWPVSSAVNPAAQLVFDLPEDAGEVAEADATAPPPPLTVGLPQPTTPTAVALPEPPTQPYNVVWIIMESTGTRYFEGAFHSDLRPMPTLQRLADEGWYLTRHQSPSNSSATSIFAQLSGLYPVADPQMFATQRDNYVPALPGYLPPNYERFLYTPGRLNFFFPEAFLRHAGLNEMVGYDEMPVARNVGVERMSKDETQSVSAFLARLQRAKEPFLGIYYSFSPHWPYTDYGPSWQRYAGNQPLDHYHNALWLLDQQIARIVEQLRIEGRLDRTILVLAGDHGEAFGQHAHNWAHARGSYQENFETPAVLWQPKVFAPRRVVEPTSHVDLLPTVLDALHVPFDGALLQGKSLWQPIGERMRFAWSNEGMATVSTAAGMKLSWSVRDNHCRVFDLATDPQERHARRCDEQAELLARLKAWREDQRRFVKAQSDAARMKSL